MQLFFMFLPIVASLIILIYALKKGFDRTAFYISAAIAMVIAIAVPFVLTVIIGKRKKIA